MEQGPLIDRAETDFAAVIPQLGTVARADQRPVHIRLQRIRADRRGACKRQRHVVPLAVAGRRRCEECPGPVALAGIGVPTTDVQLSVEEVDVQAT